MNLKRVEKLLQKVNSLQKASGYSLCMAMVMPTWAADRDADGHSDSEWFCHLTIGKPKGSDEWSEIETLPTQWFPTRDEAMAAAKSAEKLHPPVKRRNGMLSEPSYLTFSEE